MKKIVALFISIIIFSSLSFASEQKDNETLKKQEEKTNKLVKDFIKNIETTIVDSTKKIADEINTINK